MDKPILLGGLLGTVTVIAFAIGYKVVMFLKDVNFKKKPQTTEIKAISLIDVETEKERLAFIKRKPPDLWNTVLFFPDLNPEAEDSPTRQFISYFENTKTSLQICIFLASYPELTNVIIAKKKSGLLVQVLSDHDSTTTHNNFSINRFKQSEIVTGVRVLTKNSGNLMHNKFVIFDDEAVLTGSLNWTKQGFLGNSENVVITTHERIVAQYKTEFNRLWRDAEQS